MTLPWPLPEQFRVRLRFESDWHVGSGLGRPGQIDRLVTRDAEDLPFVPAKTLRGIWRDACERLCRGLDDGKLGPWSQLVDRLFGSQPGQGAKDPTGRHTDPREVPLPSALQVRPARLPLPLRQRLAGGDAGRRQLRQALTFIKPGVKIDRRSGSAQTDFLRFEEVARKGLFLEAECRLAIPDPATRALASALLIASARLVERLGGKRRRGTGRCRLEILEADLQAAIAWLKDHPTPPAWSMREQDPPQPVPASGPSRPDEGWVSVPLVLRLQGPLAIAGRTVGNVVETLDFLPGFYLLPHLTRTLPALRAGVSSGEMVVLPAYPQVDGQRGLPVPLAWFAPKGLRDPLQPEHRPHLVNRLLQPEPSDTDQVQLKQLRMGYVSLRPATLYRPPITVLTHNRVDDHTQRPTLEGGGGVYSYEAVAPRDEKNQPVIFRSELRLRASLAERLEDGWWQRLAGEIALGRSRKDDYGWVTLEVEPPQTYPSASHPRGGDTLYVWLVSDVLLRNERLRADPTADALAEELSRRLGVKLSIRDRHPASDLLDALLRTRRLDAWHVGWGLPRPSLVALQAGSCVVFRIEAGTLDPARLAQLEAGGVGERTAEGFGQLLFNSPLIATPPTQWPAALEARPPEEGHAASELSAMDEATAQLGRLIETECWKQQIRRRCLEIAAERQLRAKYLGWSIDGAQGAPPMSQLGALRGQCALLRSSENRAQVLAWLKHLESNKRRSEKWPANAIQAVNTLIEAESRIWEILQPDGWPTLTADGPDALRRVLWPLAVRSFFDACIRAHKRDLEGQRFPQETHRGA